MIDALCLQILSQRFVTIIGPGGVGRTTVSVATAQSIASDFGEAATIFAYLRSQLSGAGNRLVLTAVGCNVRGSDPLESLAPHLAFLAATGNEPAKTLKMKRGNYSRDCDHNSERPWAIAMPSSVLFPLIAGTSDADRYLKRIASRTPATTTIITSSTTTESLDVFCIDPRRGERVAPALDAIDKLTVKFEIPIATPIPAAVRPRISLYGRTQSGSGQSNAFLARV